ncbi:MAG: 2'-5' RNA ligase family protein [Gemmatimonadaceae bacterium]
MFEPAEDDDNFAALSETWQRPAGIFVIVEARGAAGERIRQLQQQFDPKLAATNPPHLTLVGSSGLGPIVGDTSEDELRMRLAPIARTTAPFALAFGPTTKFLQRNIVVLPLSPHGILRELHDRIARSGLIFNRARFAFTPHVTVNLFRTLPRDELRALLAERVTEPLIVDHLRVSLTDDPAPARDLFEIPLTG